MVQAVEKNMNAARAGLDKESLLDLEDALAKAKQATQGRDAKALQKARDEFERTSLPLAELLMNNVAQKALMGRSLGEV